MASTLEPPLPAPQALRLGRQATERLTEHPAPPSRSQLPEQQLPPSPGASVGGSETLAGTTFQPDMPFASWDGTGTDAEVADVSCTSDTGTEECGASSLQKSMRDSLLQMSGARGPCGSTSGRHSSQSRRSSIVPADDILPHRPQVSMRPGGARCSATSAVLGLLKEESDCFEDDAPLSFLQPTGTASLQLKRALCVLGSDF